MGVSFEPDNAKTIRWFLTQKVRIAKSATDENAMTGIAHKATNF